VHDVGEHEFAGLKGAKGIKGQPGVAMHQRSN